MRGPELSTLLGAAPPRVTRRAFVTLLGGAAVWPLPALAQQSALPVIGFLGVTAPDTVADRLRAFRQGLKESGYLDCCGDDGQSGDHDDSHRLHRH